jgi:DNA-binding response OmpR family regulator
VAQQYVLVVEDDASLRELYRSALRTAGFEVVAVEDGLSALHRLDSGIPRAVVLDLDLPRVGGRDVQAELKSRPDTQLIPIVVVSGKDTDDLNPRDFACILRKPVSTDELIAAVQRCIVRAATAANATAADGSARRKRKLD